MFLERAFVLVISLSILFSPQVSLAANSYSGSLKGAATQGTETFLTTFEQLVKNYPEDAIEIIEQAKVLHPELLKEMQEISLQANPKLVDDPAFNNLFEVEPAAGPLLAAAAVGGFSGGTVAAAAAGAAAVAAAAGGGGGGGGSTGTTTTPPSPEYLANWGLAAINASAAYARGYTGKGVTIAVLDGPMREEHSEFTNAIREPNYNHNLSFSSLDNHGTFVSGIIGARKDGVGVHGVAYDSKIMPLNIFPEEYTSRKTSFLREKEAVEFARNNGARIINGSWMLTEDDNKTPLHNITSTHIEFFHSLRGDISPSTAVVSVFAAGNKNGEMPVFPGLAPLIKPENHDKGYYTLDEGVDKTMDWSILADTLLVVGAIDKTGAITDYSNRCGLAAQWCLVAPGDEIVSTSNNGYGEWGGTSFAAPHVSGAAAILMEMFPELSAEEIVQILLESANKTGIYGNSEIYGQGLLDLEAATRPLGEVAFAGANLLVEGSSFQSSAAFGGALSASLSGFNTRITDGYGRGYTQSLTGMVSHKQNPVDLEENFNLLSALETAQTYKVSEGFSFTTYASTEENLPEEISFQFSSGNTKLAYNQGTHSRFMETGLFGEASSANEKLFKSHFNTAYLVGLKEVEAISMGVDLDARSSLTFSTMKAASNDKTVQNTTLNKLTYSMDGEEAPWKLSLSLGSMEEQETVLGASGSGAFAFKGAATRFVGAQGAWDVSEQTQLLASAFVGKTSVDLPRQSAFANFSELTSQEFTLGAIHKGILDKNDALSFALKAPLHVSKGSTKTNLTLVERKEVLDLAAQATEKALHLSYEATKGKNDFGVHGSYRTNPGNIQNVKDEAAFLLNWRTNW